VEYSGIPVASREGQTVPGGGGGDYWQGCVCQSENDDVWGGTGKILGGGGTALEPALTRPTFRSSRWPRRERIHESHRTTHN
jgi:hypothetical protein